MHPTAKMFRDYVLPPGVEDRVLWDPALPGFGCRCRLGGSKRGMIQYRHGKRTRKHDLGPFDPETWPATRRHARDLLAKARLGNDPAGEKATKKAAASETFAHFLPRYLARQRAKVRAKTFSEISRYLSANAKPLHHHAVTTITRRDIAKLLGEIADKAGAATANRMRSALSAYFTWLCREGLLEHSPVANTNVAPEGAGRTRVLSEAELAQIWAALDNDDFGAILRLLILSGCRREEIAALRWQEIDFGRELIQLPPERTKNGRPFDILLPSTALQILRDQPRRLEIDGSPRSLVFGQHRGQFSNWMLCMRKLNAALRIPAWVIHDIRRSFSTHLHELGTPPHVVEALLNHVSGHKRGPAGTYNKAAYLDERRRAMQRWDDHLQKLLGAKRPATITQLRK